MNVVTMVTMKSKVTFAVLYISLFDHSKHSKGRTIIFLEGGDEKFEKKNCLQSLKRQNELFAQLQNKKINCLQ